MRLIKYILGVCLFITLLTVPTMAVYISSEQFVIPWGEGQNQLKIGEPEMDEGDADIGDTVPHYYWTSGGGPASPMVDRNGNIFFISSLLRYFKGFHSNGEEYISNLEPNPIVDTIIYVDSINPSDTMISIDTALRSEDGPHYYYVDSTGLLYFAYSSMNFLDIRDNNGHFIERIYPCGIDSGAQGINGRTICCFARHSGNSFSFICSRLGTYTYANGTFIPGGTSHWLDRDRFYYSTLYGDTLADTCVCVRFRNPGPNDWSDSIERVFDFPLGDIRGGDLLAMDDEDNMYFIIWTLSDSTRNQIHIYGKDFQFKEQFTLLPQEQNKYMWQIEDPYVNYDGSVYQFLCKDDGLHVVKWTKQ